MQKRAQKKLILNRETLATLEARTSVGDTSCVDSCYFVSCGGGCGVSTALKG